MKKQNNVRKVVEEVVENGKKQEPNRLRFGSVSVVAGEGLEPSTFGL